MVQVIDILFSLYDTAMFLASQSRSSWSWVQFPECMC